MPRGAAPEEGEGSTMIKADYIAALHYLIQVSRAGGSTGARVRDMLLSLLIDKGSHVALGALLRNADRQTMLAIMPVLAGWAKYGWRDNTDIDADDYIREALGHEHV